MRNPSILIALVFSIGLSACSKSDRTSSEPVDTTLSNGTQPIGGVADTSQESADLNAAANDATSAADDAAAATWNGQDPVASPAVDQAPLDDTQTQPATDGSPAAGDSSASNPQ